MERMTKEARRAHWSGVMEAWRRSGQSKAAFCREHEIGEPVFYYWQRQLREDSSPEVEGFAQVGPVDLAGSGVRLRLPSGMVLELEAGFDAVTLSRVLAVVTGC